MARDDDLGPLARSKIDPEPMHVPRAARILDRQFERRAGVEMPDLGRIDAVPA